MTRLRKFLLPALPLLVAYVIGCAHPCQADSPGSQADWWAETQQLFSSGNYTKALEALRAHPFEDANYYYDLGTTYARMGQLGVAVAYLEKAARLHPLDPDIEANLRIERDALSRVIGEDRLDPASDWAEAFSDAVPMGLLRSGIGLLSLVLSLFWIRSYLKARKFSATLLQPVGVLGCAAIIASVGFLSVQKFAEAHPAAVSLESQVIRSGPGDHFLELAHVDAGTKLRALGPVAAENAPNPNGVAPTGSGSDAQPSAQAGAHPLWRMVRYAQNSIGWVKASSVLLL